MSFLFDFVNSMYDDVMSVLAFAFKATFLTSPFIFLYCFISHFHKNYKKLKKGASPKNKEDKKCK